MPSNRSITSSNKATHAQAAMLIKRLLASYPLQTPNDPQTYMAECALVFSRYTPQMGEQGLADVRRSSPEFLPSTEKVRVACEAIAARMERHPVPFHLTKYEYVPPPTHAGCWANLKVPAGVPGYQAMLEWSKRPETDAREWRMGPDGAIHVTLDAYQQYGSGQRLSGKRAFKQFSVEDLERLYGRNQSPPPPQAAERAWTTEDPGA